jgi:hypothetical protein
LGSVGVTFLFGGVPGALTGGSVFLGEKAWDMTEPVREEIKQQYFQFEKALKTGWKPY